MHCSRRSSASASSVGRYRWSCGAASSSSPMYDIRIASSVASIGTGDGRPRGEQRAQGLPFAPDPDPALDLASESRLLLQRDADPPLLDEFAVPVEGLVAEVATVERVVDLQRRQLFTGRARVRAHQVHARFLATLDGPDDPFDEPFVEEVLEDCRRAPRCSFWSEAGSQSHAFAEMRTGATPRPSGATATEPDGSAGDGGTLRADGDRVGSHLASLLLVHVTARRSRRAGRVYALY